MIIKSIIEIAGSPKEHIEQIIQKVIEKIDKEEKEIRLINGKIAPTKESNNVFATFAEVEVEIKNFQSLIHFCFFYMPSSIDFIEPDKFDISGVELADFLNDTLARLHKNDMTLKNLFFENQSLKKKLNPSSQK